MTYEWMLNDALTMFDSDSPAVVELAKAMEEDNRERAIELYQEMREAYYDLVCAAGTH